MSKKNEKGLTITSYWRMGLIIITIGIVVFAVVQMALSESVTVIEGQIDLSEAGFNPNKSIPLNGQWEFYWDQLLTSEDFQGDNPPKMDSFMKVPDSWSTHEVGYPKHGVATYRLIIMSPTMVSDPALRIQNISSAYKLYANGQLLTEVGILSEHLSEFKEGEESIFVALPDDGQSIELIVQVANLNFARGGLRQKPIFGSMEVLMKEQTRLLTVQMFFIGSIFIFGSYYLLVFLLQKKNKTALIFSMLCYITVLRSLIWGVAPVEIIFTDASFAFRIYINYITGYNFMPIVSLFILSLYPLVSKKVIGAVIILPTIFFNLLFLAPLGFMSFFTDYLYILMLTQMFFTLYVLIKAVLLEEENAILMFVTICLFFLTIIQDILFYKGIGGAYVPYMFLFGNFFVIMTMSFIQARKHASNYKRLILYNERLLEADLLKDKIMATEMSFLHAQIKPHFLYNALDAIANVCEKDGKRAGNLIIDLAVYLRGSLEFNNLDKMTTIEKELELVDTYINIEQARFGEKIQLIKVIESALDFKLPVLVLQPLVENAVRHGISKKLGGGTVTIGIEEIEGLIAIQIRDDGVGISEKRLKSLLTDNLLDQGVGLLNIHHRLQRLYGSGLEITSKEGLGTCVKFMVGHGGKSNGGK